MNMEQAVKAMLGGEKVAHESFTPKEWMKITGCVYEFESGRLCEVVEFWEIRDHASWQENWRVVA